MTWRIVPWSLMGLVVGGCSLLFGASNVPDGGGDASIQSALLSGLEVSSGVTLDRPFEPSQFDYTANTTELMQPIFITATAQRPNASIIINRTSVESGIASPAISLDPGSNDIQIDVSDDTGTGRYSLTIDNHNSAQTAYVKASNTGAGDQFGISVSLSGDTLVVGASFEDSAATGVGGDQGNGLENSGAVYVFRRTGTTWAQEAYIKASNPDDADWFGTSVSVFGNTLAVGARLEDSDGTDEDDDSTPNSGAVYVFRRTGTTWAQEAYIKASEDTEANDNFGQAVALGEDRLVVGAAGEDSEGVDSGAVYVFHRNSEVWIQKAFLKASNAGANDFFGEAVAIAGETLVVGASSEDSNAHGIGGEQDNDDSEDSGAVYVFGYLNNTWSQQAYIKGSDTEAKDVFGASVALSNDTLAVGAPGRLSDQTVGSAYVFHRAGDTWSEQQRLQATGSNDGDKFGSAITLVQDVLVVGASERESGGAAYIFRRIGEQWSERQFLRGSNPDKDDDFGLCMALSDDTLVVCARLEDGSAVGVGGDVDDAMVNSGAVYLFQ